MRCPTPSSSSWSRRNGSSFPAQVEQVLVPGAEGDMTVLAHHAPLLSTLRPGVLDIGLPGGERKRYFIRGGFAEVGPAGLTVLAETAIDLVELDADQLAQAVKDAEEDVADATEDAVRDRAQTRARSAAPGPGRAQSLGPRLYFLLLAVPARANLRLGRVILAAPLTSFLLPLALVAFTLRAFNLPLLCSPRLNLGLNIMGWRFYASPHEPHAVVCDLEPEAGTCRPLDLHFELRFRSAQRCSCRNG